jgi:hypothetical protein
LILLLVALFAKKPTLENRLRSWIFFGGMELVFYRYSTLLELKLYKIQS